MSRNLVLIFLLLAGLFGAWQHFHGNPKIEYQSSVEASTLNGSSTSGTVFVYGRDSCAYTRKTVTALRSNNIPVTYINIGPADANAAFHRKFGGTGLDGGRGYALPVVEFAGKVSMRPDPDSVVRQIRRAR